MNAVGKAVAILEVLALARTPLSIRETARLAGLAKATAYRILLVLEEERLATRHRSGYVLGERFQGWGGTRLSRAQPAVHGDAAAAVDPAGHWTADQALDAG
jgi:DNA-binding IclR family transcriptional regulator